MACQRLLLVQGAECPPPGSPVLPQKETHQSVFLEKQMPLPSSPAVPSGGSPAGGGGRLPSPVRSVCSEPLQWMQSGRGPACTCLPPPARDGGLVKRFSPDLLSCSPISIASACPVSICNENNKTSEAGITSLSCRTTRRISIIRNLRCTGALTRPFQEGLGSASCIYITLKSLSPRAK